MKSLRRTVISIATVWACTASLPVAAQAASEAKPPFEVKPGSFTVTDSRDQAGAHADVATSFAFTENKGGTGEVGGLLRNAEAILPIGFAGYPANVKTCTPAQMLVEECPVNSQIGTIEIVLRDFPASEDPYLKFIYPLYNLKPSPNETAVYAFSILSSISGEIVLSVGPDYRVHATAANISTYGFELASQTLTVWGVPAAASHDEQRQQRCLYFGELNSGICEGGDVPANEDPVPYLVNPTQCTTKPLEAKLVKVQSWEGATAEDVSAAVGPMTGCEALKFHPTIAVTPEESQAITPTGYDIDLRVPQDNGAEDLASADLRDAVVKLPEGVVLSPSAATGLVSCSEAEVGLGNENPVECPNASRLGEVSVITPALTEELKGFLYLGGPPSGVIRKPPFTAYLTFEGHGVLVKIRGTVTPNPVTGQLTTIFDENPELPFSELKLELNGGSRSTVANPRACGEYHAESDFTPWTSPLEADVAQLSFPYQITGCQPPRFDPSFQASTLSNQAGGYSTMRVNFSREDIDQELGGLTVTMPPGVSGNLSKVPLCPEPQAAEGTCGPESQIGEVTAGAGPGPEPVFIKGGKVFLTGPYDGAPFGLSIDVSEKAGPLDLGIGRCDCEVVRATVNINPVTAQITVSNGALPTGKDGIPFQVKSVNVDINRPEFVFNPTTCEPMSVNGTLSSVQDTLAQVSSRFQATNCAALGFKPTFAVGTSGHTSRTDGASLTAKLSYPNVGGHSILASGLANIAKVKVELPKQLPSRLTTLQKACTETVFTADPANCPAASRIGYATATTPILPVPLTGPAFFVSNGAAKFPELIVVLQGDNVTVDLHGETFISKAGITSTTFATVPDVPVGTFKLVLPEGPYSALAANGDLCAQKLYMPTSFTAQDGQHIKENTPIGVSGCRPAIRVIRHRVSGKKATVLVSVPSPGTLTAGGGGVRRTTRAIARAGNVTLALRLSSSEERFLVHHRDRRLQVPITFSFTPAHGERLEARVAVLMR